MIRYRAMSRAVQAKCPRLRVCFIRNVPCCIAGILLLSIALASNSGTAAPKESGSSSRLPLILDQSEGLPRSLFPFHSYGANSGLDNLAVRRIVQDKIGFLWVGTEDGLYRFDGERFSRYDSSKGLPSTWIADLLATPEGDLWICTPQGLAVRKGIGFEAVPAGESGLPEGPCNAIARDDRGVIWVAHKAGLYFQRNGRFHRLPGFPAGSVSAIVSANNPSGPVYASVKGIVAKIENYRVTGKYAIRPSNPEMIESLAADNSGRIWAQSARKLFCLLPGSTDFRDESVGIPAVSSRGLLSIDRSGRLWVPTDEGMSCRTGDNWRHFDPEDGLPTDWTRYVFEDREGSLWVASIGIHRLIGRGSWTSWTRAQGLPSETVWSIYRSRRGDLWISTDKGLCRATSKGWQVLPGTEKTVVRQIQEDSKGRLWMGLVPAGIFRYNPATNELIKYDSNSGVAGLRVLCLREDAEGQIWAATDGAGLLRFRPETNNFVREEVPDGTAEETFRYILRDSQNRLWVTGEHGLLLRIGSEWRRFTRANGFKQNHVSYITELSSGDFWLSYFEPLGIIRFELSNGTIRIREHLDRANGLSSAKVYLLGEDLSNNLWVGTGKGIDIISPKGMVHFSKGDGLAGDDVDAMAYLVEPNGSVFVGTSSGLSMYRSETDSEHSLAPMPVILTAQLGDRILPQGDSATPKYPSSCNVLNLDFASLSFLHQSQIEYAARLNGIETEWHSAQRNTHYAGLPPGKYTYEVRARLGSGPWSQPARLVFQIQPPWWRTWPALVSWVVLIATAIFIGMRWRMQHLRKRTRQLESLVSARTIELAMANADLERLSITDPLTGLKNRRYLEFSILEDMARVRRASQPIEAEWQGFEDTTASITFLVIDIDHFKKVNDEFGHNAGDRVLRQMGAVLGSAVRESDTTVRWGGEEFLVIARNPKGSDPTGLAERVRKNVEAAIFAVSQDQNIHLTCSGGYASWPFFKHEPDALGWQEVLALADRCLYLAKKSGRNAWFGVSSAPNYRGIVEYTALNDFRAAESTGIITVQSSASMMLPSASSLGTRLKGSEKKQDNRDMEHSELFG